MSLPHFDSVTPEKQQLNPKYKTQNTEYQQSTLNTSWTVHHHTSFIKQIADQKYFSF